MLNRTRENVQRLHTHTRMFSINGKEGAYYLSFTPYSNVSSLEGGAIS